MKKVNFVVIGLIAITFTGCYQAKSVKVKTDEKFYRIKSDAPFSVVLFYEEEKELSKEYKKHLKELRSDFKTLSKSKFFKEGDVSFIEVNVARKDLNDLDDEYKIKKLPAILLFKKGKQVRADDNGKERVILVGFPTHKIIRDFVDKYLEEDIEERVEEKEEERERRRQERAYYGPHWGWGVGWGWPYYGHYGYGWPYYSGWGGRWGCRGGCW